MGQIFPASDTKLERKVAQKFDLPEWQQIPSRRAETIKLFAEGKAGTFKRPLQHCSGVVSLAREGCGRVFCGRDYLQGNWLRQMNRDL